MSGPTPPCKQVARAFERVLSVTTLHLFGAMPRPGRGSSLARRDEGNSSLVWCVGSEGGSY